LPSVISTTKAVLASHHQRQREPAGDHMGLHRLPQQAQAGLQVLLPQGVLPVGQRITAPDGVHQDVEPAVLLPADPAGQGAHLLGAAVAAKSIKPAPSPP
jgi:hypothetical protein